MPLNSIFQEKLFNLQDILFFLHCSFSPEHKSKSFSPSPESIHLNISGEKLPSKKTRPKIDNSTGAENKIVAPFLQKNPPGFTLIECLLSLSLSLLILISALEIFSQARKVFYRLKEEHESTLAAVTALEKIQEDLETAGAGLVSGTKDSNFFPLSVDNSSLLIFSRKKNLRLAADIEANQNFILIVPESESSSSLRKGQAIFLKHNQQGELVYITGVSDNRLTVSPPLINSYSSLETEILLLEKIEIYLDGKQKTLRRKVNDTSGQPLLEEVTQFEPFYDSEKNLLQIRLTAGESREKNYELVFYPKNIFKNSRP
ncbi:MAG: hypothetical protein H5U06_05755 [Candidatus Aminicenantes bacterium]|nr:hypothetical protein [Candidatus Aminicenantes bacterium]